MLGVFQSWSDEHFKDREVGGFQLSKHPGALKLRLIVKEQWLCMLTHPRVNLEEALDQNQAFIS